MQKNPKQNELTRSAKSNADGSQKSSGNIVKKLFPSVPTALLFSALTIGSLLVSCQNSYSQNNKKEVMQNNQEQKDGILKPIELYIEAGRKGDGNIANPAFASTATMSWSENGVLKSVPIQALFDGFSAAEPMEASYKITTLM